MMHSSEKLYQKQHLAFFASGYAYSEFEFTGLAQRVVFRTAQPRGLCAHTVGGHSIDTRHKNREKQMRNSVALGRQLLTTTAIGLAMGLSSVASAQEQQSEEEVTPAETVQSDSEPEIVVSGTRASIGNSIDAKRNSDTIVDILSADDADRFPDNNIAEGLARIPGISFQRDNDTSDGEFISIRGLDATFNTVTSNGIRVGTADTFRRTPLNIVTGNGISSIAVIKVPLPEHSSEGIGGVVDIRTRGALERSEAISFGARLDTNSFAENDGFRINGGFTSHITDTFGVNLNVSFRRRFFNNLQINPSTAVPEILFPQEVGGTVFDDADDIEDIFDLIPTGFLDISNFTTEQVDYEAADIRDDNLSISGTLQWELSDTTTWTVGGRYNRNERDEIVSNIEFDADPDDFVDGSLVPGGTPGQLIRSFRDPEITFEGQIEDEFETQENFFFRGETEVGNWQFDYVAGYSRAFKNDPILSIDFTQELEDIPGSPGTNTAAERAVSFAPFNLGGLFVGPNPLNQEIFNLALDPFCQDPDRADDEDFQTGTCGEIFDFDEDLVDSSENERFSGRLDITRTFDGGFLDYVKAGVVFENSTTTEIRIDASDVDDTLAEFVTDIVDGVGVDQNGDPDNSPGTLGVFSGTSRSLNDIGNPFQDVGFTGIPRFSRAGLLSLRNRFRVGFAAADGVPNEDLFTEADETFYSGYIQAKASFDRLSIVGGVRIERYDADLTSPSTFESDIFFELPGAVEGENISLTPVGNNLFAQSVITASNTEVLPRFLVNYDISDEFRVRAAFSTSIARPTFDLLLGSFEGGLDIELNPGVAPADATLADVAVVDADFEFGNPDLLNGFSKNFDVSFEYFADRTNAFSVAFFYKDISDFIFSTFATDVDVASAGGFGVSETIGQILAGVNFSPEGEGIINQLGGIEALLNSNVANVSIVQPTNGNDAEVYGVEFGVSHSFDYLPGLLANTGFIGNVTFQETNTTLPLGTLDAEDVLVQIGEREAGDILTQSFPFFNSPDFIGNVALYYDDRSFEATVSYRFSGNQFEELEAFGISQFQRGRGFLDVDLEYTFRDLGPLNRLTLTFEASDLLDTGRRFSVFETRGETDQFSDLATFNGRNFRFGARVRF